MRLETAIKHIKKEAEFLGFSFSEVLEDVRVAGPMVYSERTVEAFRIITDKYPDIFREIA